MIPATHAVRRGMTLIELMVALVITGMALAAGYAALSTVIDRRTQTNTEMTDVARATAVRRTIVDWLEHAQLQFTSGIPGQSSNFGAGSNQTDGQLQFVTTAPTPLRSDSTIVSLYVGTYNANGLSSSPTVRGLLAILTPSISATMTKQAASGSSSGHGSADMGQFGRNPFANSSSADAGSLVPDSLVVPLDSAVTGALIEYLVEQADQQHWVTSDVLASLRGSQSRLIAVRLTLMSSGPAVLPPVMRLPIVVPMQRAL